MAALALAEPASMKTSSDPAADYRTEPGITVPPTVLTPDSNQGSDPEFPINLILAPEPSLMEGLSRPKTRSGPSHSAVLFDANWLLRLPSHWLWVLFAITFIVLVGVVVLAVIKPSADRTSEVGKS